MLIVDLAILVGVAAILVIGGAVIGGRSLGARLEKKRRELQGKRNAELERRRLDEVCAACGEPVDAGVDLFERDQWWHRRCWRETVE